MVGTTPFGTVRLRQITVLHEDHLEVTVFRTRRLPWSEIHGFEGGSAMRGGTLIETTDGPVHSSRPGAGRGVPPADLQTLRRQVALRTRLGGSRPPLPWTTAAAQVPPRRVPARGYCLDAEGTSHPDGPGWTSEQGTTL